jgi:hypothetical protein
VDPVPDPLHKEETKSVALSPQVNYTDRATAAVGELNPDFCRLRVFSVRIHTSLISGL